MASSFSSFSSPWPDPNSPVLSKIDFGVPLVELFKWLDIRDTLLGDNKRKQDITSALALACDCKHPDAGWLTSIFEGKDVSTKEDVKKVLLLNENDARALCFAWFLNDDRWNDLSLLRRSSEMGNAFACSALVSEVRFENEKEAFLLAQLAAAQHERDGFYQIAFCLRAGVGCEKGFNMAKESYLIAAELGSVYAAEDYGDLLDKSDPGCWLWLGRAASHGSPRSFLFSFSEQVERFFSGSGNATVVFLIGRALKGNMHVQKMIVFGTSFKFDSLIGPANLAVSFYDCQIKSARLAVDIWSLLSTRLHLIKDMRIFIGKIIWDARFDANYKI